MNTYLVMYRGRADGVKNLGVDLKKWVVQTDKTADELLEAVQDLGRGTWHVTLPEFTSEMDFMLNVHDIHFKENGL